MKIFVLTLILIMSSVIFSVNSIRAQTADDITEISLKDDGGFGYERGTEVRFFSDGSAEYRGGKNSYWLKGKYRGRIEKAEFAELAKLIVKRGFFSFKDRYEKAANDAPTVTTAVVYKGGQKTVANFANSGDANLSAIERAVNALAAKVKWEKFDSQTKTYSAAEEIEWLLVLRGFNLKDVLEMYGFTDSEIEKNAAYEKLENLTAIGDKDSEIPMFFFRGEKQAIMYLTAEMLRKLKLTPDDFYKKFGKQYVELPSRAGKNHRQIVYPAQGVAFSTAGANLDFLEIFPPTTIAAYQSEIYRTVPAFTK